MDLMYDMETPLQSLAQLMTEIYVGTDTMEVFAREMVTSLRCRHASYEYVSMYRVWGMIERMVGIAYRDTWKSVVTHVFETTEIPNKHVTLQIARKWCNVQEDDDDFGMMLVCPN
jgi:hypothetical protein